MEKKLLVVTIALMLVVGTCSLASAEVFTSLLTSTGTADTLLLSCAGISRGDGLTEFSYALTNLATNTTKVSGFTIEFPGVPVNDFVVTQRPAGWIDGVIVPDSKVEWKWVTFANPAQQLDPGETFNFAFLTHLPFGGGAAANASAQDGFGFSGKTCGPVIPEPMSMVLGAMGLSALAGWKRRKK